MSLTYKDIIARQRNLITDSYTPNTSCNISNIYENLSEKYSYNKAKLVLENWQALSNSEDIAITKVLEVFNIILANDNESNIENAASLIEGKIIPKLRNAKQTRLLNNYKRGWIKHKHTSMLNDTKDNMTAVERAKNNGGYLGNSLHPNRKYKRDIYGRKMGEVKQANNGGDENESKETQVAEECFDRFIQVAYVNEQCDRVINNHNKLMKRFDLESIVRKCPTDRLSLQECVYNICRLIDSYDIPFGVKYNIALENMMFLMTKNCLPVDNSFIVESVTDYFLMSEINDDRLHDMRYIIENSKFFSDEDLSGVAYLCVDESAVIDSLLEDAYDDKCISYAMGVDDSIYKLEKEGFTITEDDGDYRVVFEWSNRKKWEKYIEEHLEDTYWNEYIRLSDNTIHFMINENGKVTHVINRQYSNDANLLKTCNRLCEGNFKTMKDLIYSNDFYKDELAKTLQEDSKLHDAFLKFKEKRILTMKKKQKVESLKIKKVIHDFKKSNKKSIESFKDAISRIFVNSPEGIINELPDIFDFVRLGIAIGAIAIHPMLGVLTIITGYFLKMKISREQMAKVVEQYSKERDKYKKKMNEADNEKDKEKYEKLYKQYKKDTEKLEMYENDLYTDAENDKRMEEKWAKEAEASMDDDDFDMDFDFDFDFEEAVKYTGMLATLYEQLDFTKAELMNTIKNNIHRMTNEDIYNITESVKLCNDVFDCPRYITILEDELINARANSYLSSIQRIDTIKSCISDIERIKYDSLLESNYSFNDNKLPPVDIMYENLKCKHDLMNDTLELLTRYKNSVVNEGKENSGMSFTSKLKIASENLRRTALKLKDKDKQLSMKLDSELNRTAKAAKRIMVSDSREQIIKGTFLPSASKCIHIALASGAAFLISPALAVIGLIGFIGCSKSLNERERNLILDDIDIEIKMCDKYLKIAEDKDDLVAVREIMKTKRDLERQRARILYNKNYVFKNKKQYDYKPKSMNKNDDDD